MKGNTVAITGGTSGMGKATAAQLAQMGATLLLVGRNRAKGEQAAEEIRVSSGNAAVTFLQADLSLVRDMRAVAEHIRGTSKQLDALIHAAGGGFPPQRSLTDEGLEVCFSVQCLARFVLTDELLDCLHASPDPKVVNIAGGAWGSEQAQFDNLQGEQSYGRFKSIGRCAAINYLLTLGHIDRYPEITFYNYGPKLVRTATVWGDSSLTRLFFNTVGRLFTRSPEDAAADIASLLADEHPSGFYGVSLKPHDTPAGIEADRALAEKLREYCRQVVAAPAPDKAPAAEPIEPTSMPG